MYKKLLMITCALLFVFSASSYAQMNIGYMNTQKVMNQLPERQKVQQQMNDFVQQKRQLLTKRSTKYQNAISEYQSKRSSMTQEQIQTREDELQAMRKSLSDYNNTIRNQVEQKRQDLLSPIFDRIDSTISVVAKGQNLDLVLNKSTSKGENLVFYASDNQTDITQMVVDRLKSSSK